MLFVNSSILTIAVPGNTYSTRSDFALENVHIANLVSDLAQLTITALNQLDDLLSGSADSIIEQPRYEDETESSPSARNYDAKFGDDNSMVISSNRDSISVCWKEYNTHYREQFQTCMVMENSTHNMRITTKNALNCKLNNGNYFPPIHHPYLQLSLSLLKHQV